MTIVEREIKKIYLWQGDAPTTYSIDFKTVSLSDLTNQWWLSSWDVWLNSSNWLYCTSSWNDKYAWVYCPVDISNANKITMKRVHNQSSWSWAWWPRFWICKSNDVDTYSLNAFLNLTSYSWYTNQEILYVEWSWTWTNLVQQSIPLSWWEYTIVFEINFNTWDVTKTVTWPTPHTQTCTLTSSQISTLKTYWYIWQRVWWWTSATSYCYSMEYEIE